MDQRQFIAGFSAYIEGELDKRRMDEFNNYIEQSEEARRMLDSYRKGLEAFREDTLEPPADLEARVMSSIHASQGKVVKLKPYSRPRYLVPAAAAAVVAMALTLSMLFSPFGINSRDIPLASSTMDVIDVQVASQKAGIMAPSEMIRKKQVSLASYHVENENHVSENTETSAKGAVFLVGGVQSTN